MVKFCRTEIKVEGSTKRWCALEGERIWYFETPEDNVKPQGANKPKGMQSVARSTVIAGLDATQSWQAPEAEAHAHAFTIVPPTKKICYLSTATKTDSLLWQEAISQFTTKSSRAVVV